MVQLFIVFTIPTYRWVTEADMLLLQLDFEAPSGNSLLSKSCFSREWAASFSRKAHL